MSSLLRAFFVVSALAVAAAILFQPLAFRRLGRRVLQIAYIYVGVVLLSALLRLLGWYPGL